VDAAEPPRIVFESAAQCRDSDATADLLRRSLTRAVAPGRGWTVSMRVDRAGPTSLRAEGGITREDGVFVAHRTIAGTTADCQALARAVGVWAALVLESELRQPALPSSPTPAAGNAAPGAVGSAGAAPVEGMGERSAAVPADGSPNGEPGGAGVGPPAADASGLVAGTASALAGTAGWPAPAVSEPPSPEHAWYLHHDEARALELGAGMFLMTGSGSGAVAGPTAFVVVEAGHGLFLRPALAFGESLTSLPPSDVSASRWLDARFDTCLRLPGLYARHHGMQLDLCGGADFGATTIRALGETTMPYVSVGPSIDMRGELGSRLSAVLRVVAGINVLRESFADLSGAQEALPLAAGRLELAFSWDVR
jgi:hypothetical protein